MNDEISVSENSHYQVLDYDDDKEIHALWINNVTFEDDGWYQCGRKLSSKYVLVVRIEQDPTIFYNDDQVTSVLDTPVNDQFTCKFGYIQTRRLYGDFIHLTLVWEDETGNKLPAKLQQDSHELAAPYDDDDVLIHLYSKLELPAVVGYSSKSLFCRVVYSDGGALSSIVSTWYTLGRLSAEIHFNIHNQLNYWSVTVVIAMVLSVLIIVVGCFVFHIGNGKYYANLPCSKHQKEDHQEKEYEICAISMA